MLNVGMIYQIGSNGWQDIVMHKVPEDRFCRFTRVYNLNNLSQMMLVDDVSWTEPKFLRISGKSLVMGFPEGSTIESDSMFDIGKRVYDPSMLEKWHIEPDDDVRPHVVSHWKWSRCWFQYTTIQTLRYDKYVLKEIPVENTVLRFKGNVKITEHEQIFK